MRHIWIHGNYMKALELNVLQEALWIQNTITEAIQLDALPSGTASWAFHSPLMYWNCSSDALEKDENILGTINALTTWLSPYNLTLRPSSVFAGKSFQGDRLMAADTLIITIVNQLNLVSSQHWDAIIQSLADTTDKRWYFYPSDGRVARSQLYEFRFKRMSIGDDITLAGAYFAMLIHVISRLRNLRAVKSWFGLLVTVFVQGVVSILASFTVCSLLDISLVQVPREFYPFVVVVIGLENMFRLINAVLDSPPERPTVTRIADALGDVGHMALAAMAQNLIALLILSCFISPGMSAFCYFAISSLCFDFILHLLFFVPILSVDVRRMELQDSLDRINLAQSKPGAHKQDKKNWLDIILKGRASTRVAGTAVSVCFILVLNWHFLESGADNSNILQRFRFLRSSATSLSHDDPISHTDLNRARSPAAWLRMQDIDNAKELINLFKPHAHSLIARIYDPITIVLKHADRHGVVRHSSPILGELIDELDRHAVPLLLVIVSIVATVTLLMNYMLYNELPDETDEVKESILTVRGLRNVHKIDVVKIAASGKGHIVSVSLDRSIAIYVLDYRTKLHFPPNILWTSAMVPPLWPITGVAIDDSGTLLALCTDTGRVAIWSLPESRFHSTHSVEMSSPVPTLFTFAPSDHVTDTKANLIVVREDGILLDIDILSVGGEGKSHRISNSSLVAATLSRSSRDEIHIITASKNGEAHVSTYGPDGWITATLQVRDVGPRLLPDGRLSKVKSVLAVPTLSIMAAIRLCEVDIVDINTKTLIHTIQTGHVKGNSLRILHSQRRTCSCAAVALHSLSIVYTDIESYNCVMHTYTLSSASDSLICLRPQSTSDSKICKGLDFATSVVHSVPEPGAWEATNVQSVVGIRKCKISRTLSSSVLSCSGSTYFNINPLDAADVVRHRTHKPDPSSQPAPKVTRAFSPDSEEWEAWTLSTAGEFFSLPLLPHTDPRNGQTLSEMYEDHLFVAKPGPAARLGKRSIAVGFGNTVKIISLGHDRFEEDREEFVDVTAATIRKRKTLGKRTQ